MLSMSALINCNPFYRLTGTASSEDAAEWETLLTKGNADESVESNTDLITGE